MPNCWLFFKRVNKTNNLMLNYNVHKQYVSYTKFYVVKKDVHRTTIINFNISSLLQKFLNRFNVCDVYGN